MFDRLGNTYKAQTHMKHVSTLEVKNNGSLKVKRCTLVITSCEASSNSKGKIEKEEQDFSNQVTVQEIGDLEAKVETAEALETLEDGGKLQLISWES